MAQKYTLSHKFFAKIHCFKRTLKVILPHDTPSHNFLINCNTLSHNFYQEKTPCRIIFAVKGHPVERHIPSSQEWKYPPPPRGSAALPNLPNLPFSECGSQSNTNSESSKSTVFRVGANQTRPLSYIRVCRFYVRLTLTYHQIYLFD